MIDVPADIQIKALLCAGRTYLFRVDKHKGSNKHYQVILNVSPEQDDVIVMVTATTISLVHGTDYWANLEKRGVIVQAVVGDAAFIRHPTLFRCDVPIVMPVSKVISKLADGLLLQCEPVTGSLLTKLRQGVLNSDTVTEDIKILIRESDLSSS